MDDIELLREYTERGSEAAFGKLVERHVDVVYSAAYRQTGSHPMAEEVTQAVFIALARKAGGFRPGTVLTGWLFTAVRFGALRARRSEARRAHYEREAWTQSWSHDSGAPAGGDTGIWEELAPHLDAVMGELRGSDREALLLRYFENRSLREVGVAMGIGEDAAKKRVARALDRLRIAFSRRGVTISAAAAGTVLAQNGVRAASPEVAASVVKVALGKGATASAAVHNITKAIMKMTLWTSAKLPLAVLSILTGTLLAIPRGETAPIPGSLDRTFSPPPNLGMVLDAAVQPDGKVIVIRNTSDFIRNAGQDEAYRQMVRLNVDGSLDLSFRSSRSYNPDSLTLQTDGKVLVGGSLVRAAGARRATVLRLEANGDLDGTFNAGVGTDEGAYAAVNGLSLERDGRVVASGTFMTFAGRAVPGLIRLGTDGSVDPSFTPPGRPGDQADRPLALSGDRWMVNLWTYTGGALGDPATASRVVAIKRLGTNGTVDPAFRMTTGVGEYTAKAVQPDGRILAAKWALASSQPLLRFNEDGTPDANFKVTLSAASGVDGLGFAIIQRVLVLPDGKIVVLGRFNRANGVERRGIARFDPTGALDPNFLPDAGFEPIAEATFRSMLLQRDGRMIVAGTFATYAGKAGPGLVRLIGDGTVPIVSSALAGGRFRIAFLNGFGESGPISIESSTDLVSWTPAESIPERGPDLILTVGADDSSRRFFRGVLK